MSQLPTLMKLIDKIKALFSKSDAPAYPPPPRWDALYEEDAPASPVAPIGRPSRSIALGRRGRPVAAPRRAA
jgi:hypothetical protein